MSVSDPSPQTLPTAFSSPSSDAPQPRYGKAIWDYEAIEDNELTFRAGALVEIIELCNEDWYEGKIDGAQGYFPANRVVLVSDEEHAKSIPTAATSQGSTSVTGVAPTRPRTASIQSRASMGSPSVTVPSPAAQAAQELAKRQASVSSGGGAASPGSGTLLGGLVQEPSSGEENDPFGDGAELGAVSSVPLEDTSFETDAVMVGEDDFNDVPELEAEDEPDPSDDWRTVSNSDGSVYYWNVTTGETSWELPAELEVVDEQVGLDELQGKDPLGRGETGADFDTSYYNNGYAERSSRGDRRVSSLGSGDLLNSSTGTSDEDDLAQQIELVPPEIIRREGAISVKKSRDAGGKEAKRHTSWHDYWGVVCVGFLCVYKDEPLKLRKKSDKLNPIHVIRLTTITTEPVRKEQSRKKNAFALTLEDGAQWILVPGDEGETNGWMDTLREASREKSTASEYENATTKLFTKVPRADETPSSKKESRDLPRRLTGGKADEGKDTLRRIGSSKDKKVDRPATVEVPGEDGEEKTKTKVKNKLGAFFSKRPPVDKLKEKGIIPEDLVFGGVLDLQVRKEGKPIPTIVEMCVNEVDRRGLQSQGIYRLSGNASTIQKIRMQFNQQETTPLDDETVDINVVAGVLKLYFRELQNPLIPFEYYEKFIEAARIEDYDDRLIEIKSLIHSLPKANYAVLEYLMRHLCRVAAESEINKMEPPNLAIVFGPTLIRMPEEGQTAYVNMMNMAFHNSLVEAVLKQTDWVFSPIETIPVE